jgi:hypothetical protein
VAEQAEAHRLAIARKIIQMWRRNSHLGAARGAVVCYPDPERCTSWSARRCTS